MVDKDYTKQVSGLIGTQKKCYENFQNRVERDNLFSGPSLYFHRKSLALRDKAFKSKKYREDFLEMIYATLVSWGMHQMGNGGPKMVAFDTFCKNIDKVWDDILKAREYNVKAMGEDNWAVVERIYKGISVMNNNSHLVGNSKVMAHLLPNIVAPIDREYTISFLNKRKLKRGMKTKIVPNNRNNTITKKNDAEYKQWDVFYNITEGFFHKIAQDRSVQKFCNEKKGSCNWNTSLLKFVDNLVIGAKPKKIKKKIREK